MRKFIKRLVILCGVSALICAWPVHWLWTEWRTCEFHPVANSSWISDRNLNGITFHVVDPSGRPIEGVNVRMIDTSGGHSGLTDNKGVCKLQPDGGMTGFQINGVAVMPERDLFVSEVARRKLTVEVVVKDLKAIGLK